MKCFPSLVACLWITGFTVSAVSADPPKSSTVAAAPKIETRAAPCENEHTEIIQLGQASAASVARAISQLGLPVWVSSTRRNQLLLRGCAEDVERAIELVERLDVPETAAVSEVRTQFLPLGNRSTKHLEALLSTIIPQGSGRFAIDRENHLLVIDGTPDAISTVQRLLGTMDAAASSLTLHFSFLRATIGTGANPQTGRLPKSLAPVGKSLRDNGLQNLSLLAPIMVAARDGESFRTESHLQIPESDEGEEQLIFQVEGDVRLLPDGETVLLHISAQVNGEYTSKVGRGETMFNAESNIVSKLGSYVVLAAAPSSTSTGDAVAVVLRVTKQ